MVRVWVRATQVSTVPWVDFSKTHSGVSLIYVLTNEWVGMWTHRSPQVFTASNKTHLPLLQSNLNPNSVPVLLILRDLMTSSFSSVALIYLQQDCVGSIGRSFTCSRRLRYLLLHLLSLGIIYRQGCPLSVLLQCRCPVTNRGLFQWGCVQELYPHNGGHSCHKVLYNKSSLPVCICYSVYLNHSCPLLGITTWCFSLLIFRVQKGGQWGDIDDGHKTSSRGRAL